MRDPNDWVKDRLWEWSDWSKRLMDGIGYPSTSIEYRVMKEGFNAGVRRGGSGIRVTEDMPDEVWDTEAAVLKLPERQRQAIKEKYLRPGTDKQRAKACRMGYAEYRRVLDQAHWRIAGWLEAAREAG